MLRNPRIAPQCFGNRMAGTALRLDKNRKQRVLTDAGGAYFAYGISRFRHGAGFVADKRLQFGKRKQNAYLTNNNTAGKNFRNTAENSQRESPFDGKRTGCEQKYHSSTDAEIPVVCKKRNQQRKQNRCPEQSEIRDVADANDKALVLAFLSNGRGKRRIDAWCRRSRKIAGSSDRQRFGKVAAASVNCMPDVDGNQLFGAGQRAQINSGNALFHNGIDRDDLSRLNDQQIPFFNMYRFDCLCGFAKLVLFQKRSRLREDTEDGLSPLLLATHGSDLNQLDRLIKEHHQNGRHCHPGCKPCKARNYNRQGLTAVMPQADVMDQIEKTVKSDKDKADGTECSAQQRAFAQEKRNQQHEHPCKKENRNPPAGGITVAVSSEIRIKAQCLQKPFPLILRPARFLFFVFGEMFTHTTVPVKGQTILPFICLIAMQKLPYNT